MEDLSERLAIRDRYRRKLALRKSPAQRMRAMAKLQESMWATLRRSPAGYAHFLRRNFRARAVPVNPGLPEEDVKPLFDSSVEAEQICYASLEWLRRTKQAASRSKDMLDLENLPD